MKKSAFLLLAAILTSFIFPFIARAQSNDSKGFEFGLNFGVYMPSKYTANYYNGTSGNLNNTNWVMNNQVFYDTIYYRLGAIDTVYIDEGGWPTNMHYKISIMPGIYGQYTFNDEYALFFEFNYVKLVTQDALTFTKPKPFTTFPDLTLCPIRGEEKRVYIDLGLRRNFPISDQMSWFVIGGLNLNNTTVVKSSFYIDEREFTIINNYINGIYTGPNSQTLNIKQGGIGWGMFLSGGLNLRFGNISFEPGFNAHFVNVDLDGYKKYKPGAGFYIRFSLNNFLFPEE